MLFRKLWVWPALLGICAGAPMTRAQDAAEKSSAQANPETARLVEELRAHEARIKELEEKLAQLLAGKPAETTGPEDKSKETTPPSPAEANPQAVPAPTTQAAPEPPAEHEHTVRMPGGGPELKIRGFADFNLGFGSAANSLIFPLPAPVHNTFQAGEFDLFLSSRLSKKVSFVSEIIYGSDPSNEWGLDIERFQLTYKASPYLQISGGRFHTSIGYYNTAFHHGTWFQTATGRPFMYYFEDSGGLLPVHGVGISATGLVPGTGRMELHWVAEVSNGRASDRNLSPVQNFLSDRNRKAVNVAAYIKPQWLSGLQVGGSYYHDRLVPPGITHVNQDISSLYAVYNNGTWEILGEGVLLSNEADGTGKRFNSPLTYAQISRKFGQYRPYFRYQYLNVPSNDPINVFTGRYDGPSIGLRMDFTEFAALKAQYNRIYLRDATALNGVDLQVAFTF